MRRLACAKPGKAASASGPLCFIPWRRGAPAVESFAEVGGLLFGPGALHTPVHVDWRVQCGGRKVLS